MQLLDLEEDGSFSLPSLYLYYPSNEMGCLGVGLGVSLSLFGLSKISFYPSLPALRHCSLRNRQRKLHRCRFLHRQRKLGRCRFLHRQQKLCRCRSRIGSGTASLPISASAAKTASIIIPLSLNIYIYIYIFLWVFTFSPPKYEFRPRNLRSFTLHTW